LDRKATVRDKFSTNQELQIFGSESLPELYFLRREINGWVKTSKGLLGHRQHAAA
jgi:hypothetical protein